MGMDSGLYAAYTGLAARTQALDTAANNLANAGTNGFRAQRDYFRGVLVEGLSPDSLAQSQVGQTVNNFGILGGNALDLGQGQLAATGNPLDLGIQGSGFFAIQTKNGIRYTRDGAFTRSSTGVLQTSMGEPVLDPKLKPITIPSGEIHISPDGSVSTSDPDGSALVGQVGLFDFESRYSLTAEGVSRFAADENARGKAATGSIQQGAVEGANQDAIHGTMQMVLMQRQAEMMQKALSVFNNEFDKTATEELPRV